MTEIRLRLTRSPAISSTPLAALRRGSRAIWWTRSTIGPVASTRMRHSAGPDDAFLTTVVRLLRILPVYPVFGWGETRLQPVYIEDVAEGIARVLSGTGGSVAS